MPSMFDSHEEFSEWFSKDIENHAERQSGIDESKSLHEDFIKALDVINQVYSLKQKHIHIGHKIAVRS